MLTEYKPTYMKIETNLYKRTKLYCIKENRTIYGLVNELLADFMKGKRVR